jgi:hypothetical protein
MFAGLAMRRLAARLLGESPEAALDAARSRLWSALVARLANSEAGQAVLAELGEMVSAPLLSSAPAHTSGTKSVLELPLDTATVDEIGQPLGLNKTRRGAQFAVNDYTAINALSEVPEASLRRLFHHAAAIAQSEEAAYLAAIAAYVLREFQACADALLRCIEFDPDVEEYWHILAFALRYLGNYAECERIMFDSDRDRELVARIRRRPAQVAKDVAANRDSNWRQALYELQILRGVGFQIAQYMAVLCGVRRSLDDWVPAPQLAAYRQKIGRLGLTLEIDCAFLPIPDPDRVVGLEFAPTTRFVGRRFSRDLETDSRASVHVIVGGRPEWAAECLASGWYPLVLEDRVAYKTRIDFRRMGEAFGYPDCCVRFFMQHNDWPRQSTMAESLKASRELSWKANCVPKNTPWMLIFHMPCSFDCPATLEYSTVLMKELVNFDVSQAETIENMMKGTYLVASEKLCYQLFDASSSGFQAVRYARAESLHRNTSLRDPQDDRYVKALAAGNELSVSEGVIFIRKDGNLREAIPTRCDRGVAEVPLVLSFR